MSLRTSPGVVLDSQTKRAIDEYLEELYASNRTRVAGEEMSRVGLGMAQVRGLESIVKSTTRFSEIINFIKNQAGKEPRGKEKWMVVAPELLGQLEELEKVAGEMGEKSGIATLDVKLKLAIGWVNQVVAHYLYCIAQRQAEGR